MPAKSAVNEPDTVATPDRRVPDQITNIPPNRIPFLLAAYGDALGAGVEGGHALGRAQADARDDIGLRFFPYSPFGFREGELTDDSQMAWALISRLNGDRPPLDHLTGRQMYLQRAFDAYRRWYRSQPPDVGGQTATALAHDGHYGGWHAWNGGTSAGNGSLMRATGPLALGYRGSELITAEVLDSVLTHSDPTCVAACVWYAATLDSTLDEDPSHFNDLARNALSTLDTVDPGAGLRNLSPEPQLATFLDRWPEAVQLTKTTVSDAIAGKYVDCEVEHHSRWPTGWVVSSLAQATWAAAAGRDAADAIRLAVRHGGRDADTIGAIAGGLAGARFGAAAFDTWDGALLTDLRFGHTWEDASTTSLLDALAEIDP